MSFSPRNLTTVSIVSRYARRDVTLACSARWETAMQVGWRRNVDNRNGFSLREQRYQRTIPPRPSFLKAARVLLMSILRSRCLLPAFLPRSRDPAAIEEETRSSRVSRSRSHRRDIARWRLNDHVHARRHTRALRHLHPILLFLLTSSLRILTSCYSNIFASHDRARDYRNFSLPVQEIISFCKISDGNNICLVFSPTMESTIISLYRN